MFRYKITLDGITFDDGHPVMEHDDEQDVPIGGRINFVVKVPATLESGASVHLGIGSKMRGVVIGKERIDSQV